MVRAFRKLGDLLRREGLSGLIRRALGYRRRVMVFVERDLALEDRVPFMPREPAIIRFMTPAEIDLLAPHVTPERLETYRRRIADGVQVMGYFTPDETACSAWLWTTGRDYYEPFDRVTYLATPSDALHLDGEVAADNRGRGVAFTAYPLVWSHWRRQGYAKIHCTIDELNKPSLKIHDRMGYREAERFSVISLLGLAWARPGGPRHRPGDARRRG